MIMKSTDDESSHAHTLALIRLLSYFRGSKKAILAIFSY